MNWKKGFKRITFLLSIVCAVWAGISCYQYYAGVLRDNQEIAIASRNNFPDEIALRNTYSRLDGLLLIYEWKQAKTLEEQQHLWKEWTGMDLSTWWTDDPRADLAIQKELEKLKEQGWHTIDGHQLSETPEEIWWKKQKLNVLSQAKRLSESESQISMDKWRVLFALPIGAFIGFCSVWAVFAAVKWGAWPMYKWISLGFREDKQKDEQIK